MKLTKGQKRDLKTIEHFMYPGFTGIAACPCGAIESSKGVPAEQAFFDHSDRGISYKGREVKNVNRLHQLIEGKRWRGIHVQMYEEGVLDGSTPYSVLLQGLPVEVMQYLARTMFKGIDRKLIEDVFDSLPQKA